MRALGLKLVTPTEANGVFVELRADVHAALEARGWHFYRFVGDDGYRLMCSWETQLGDVSAFLSDVREILPKK